MGAGIGCGIACGIAAGRTQARKELAKRLEELESTGRIRITDAGGQPIAVDGLLDDALPDSGLARPRVMAAVGIVLGVLMLAGVVTFVLMRT